MNLPGSILLTLMLKSVGLGVTEFVVTADEGPNVIEDEDSTAIGGEDSAEAEGEDPIVTGVRKLPSC